jgi:hypothetical protein
MPCDFIFMYIGFICDLPDNSMLWKVQSETNYEKTVETMKANNFKENEQPPFISNHWNKKVTIFANGNPGPGLGRAAKGGGLKPIIGSQPSHLDNSIYILIIQK